MLFNLYPYHVYIVKCSDGSLYTGITNSLERRILQHNGKMSGGAKYTKSKRPVELVHVEKFKTSKEARQREAEIKGWRREKKLSLIKSA